MRNNKDITQELNDMQSPLADISPVMPYTLPAGYFDHLDKSILANIKLVDSADPVLNLGKKMPFELPAGYFTSFEEQIKDRLPETGLPQTITPFATPAGYFDHLPEQVLSIIKSSEQPVQKTRTISLGTEIWRQVRWAAAAILLLGIGLGSLNKFIKPVHTNPELALSKVSKVDISNYVDQNIDDFDADLITDNISANDISIMTKQLDDKDITQYLDENGWDRVE